MFRWPYSRPPKNSYFKRGTPVAMSFKTTDHARLLMEARHKLFQAISVRCCRRLEVDIVNGDPYPGTIMLELVLIDGETPGALPMSVGVAPVSSVPDVNVNPVRPVRETIQFPLPPTPRIDQFDQIKVNFHRTLNCADRSARISIERFVLRP